MDDAAHPELYVLWDFLHMRSRQGRIIDPAQPVHSAGWLCTPAKVHNHERHRSAIKQLYRIILIIVTLLGGSAARVQASKYAFKDLEEGLSDNAINRVPKYFDFDERPLGNLEDVPMYWEKVTGQGFPHYVNGGFDFETGYPEPPSFALRLDGGSVGYRFLSRKIPVVRFNDYMVMAFVRTSGLTHARAYLSAWFLDRLGNIIPDSGGRSRLVGGSKDDNTWQVVHVPMTRHTDRARFMGLGVYLVQGENLPGHDADGHTRHNLPEDIHATVWFDQIAIMRLPRIELWTDAVANVFTHEDTPELHARVRDLVPSTVDTWLALRDADGKVLETISVPAKPIKPNLGSALTEYFRLDLSDLGPGWYHADIVSSDTDSGIIGHDQLSLAILTDLSQYGKQHPRRSFGLSVPDLNYENGPTLAALAAHLGIGMVKVPIWRRDLQLDYLLEPGGNPETTIHNFIESNIHPVGLLISPPAKIARDADWPDLTVTDVLAGNVGYLPPELRNLIGRYGQGVHSWQIGCDLSPLPQQDDLLARVLENGPDMFIDMGGSALFALPKPPAAEYPPGVPYPAISTFVLPEWITPSRIPDLVNQYRHISSDVWATVALPDVEKFNRFASLDNFAWRVIHTHAANATVFSPPLWQKRPERGVDQFDPLEAFVVYRTLAHVIGDHQYAGTVYVNENEEAMIFESPTRSVVVLSYSALQYGHRLTEMFPGQTGMAVDVWGRPVAIPERNTTNIYTMGRLPVMLSQVQSSLARAHMNSTFEPTIIPVGTSVSRQRMTVKNTFSEALVGRITLNVPQDWDIYPAFTDISLAPGDMAAFDMELHIPSNASVGKYEVLANFDCPGAPTPHFVRPFRIEYADDDIEMNVVYQWQGDDLVIYQNVVNKAATPIDLIGSLLAEGYPRQEQLLGRIAPNLPTSREYRLKDARHMAGQKIRVGLKRIRGYRIINQVLTIE